jgi:hypothetical protein
LGLCHQQRVHSPKTPSSVKEVRKKRQCLPVIFLAAFFHKANMRSYGRSFDTIGIVASPQRQESDSRQNWLNRLGALASIDPDQMGDEWESLLKDLGLPLSSWLPVFEVLKQGRWRNAGDPRAYVKTVAKREAQKLGLAKPKDVMFESYQEADTQHDGVFVPATVVPEQHGEEWEDEMRRERLGSAYREVRLVPRPDLMVLEEPPDWYARQVEEINAGSNDRHIHLQPKYVPDWEKWAATAGLDSWERRVLTYQRHGMSRERALAEQPDEISRKALQAAWKRFDRNGRERLKKNS